MIYKENLSDIIVNSIVQMMEIIRHWFLWPENGLIFDLHLQHTVDVGSESTRATAVSAFRPTPSATERMSASMAAMKRDATLKVWQEINISILCYWDNREEVVRESIGSLSVSRDAIPKVMAAQCWPIGRRTPGNLWPLSQCNSTNLFSTQRDCLLKCENFRPFQKVIAFSFIFSQHLT